MCVLSVVYIIKFINNIICDLDFEGEILVQQQWRFYSHTGGIAVGAYVERRSISLQMYSKQFTVPDKSFFLSYHRILSFLWLQPYRTFGSSSKVLHDRLNRV